MRLFPINERPYIELIRYSALEDRLDFAFQFIDEIVVLFAKYGEQNDGHALVGLIKQGFKAWKKICRYEIVIDIDKDGYEYLLEDQTYPDYLMSRFLMTAENSKDFYHMKNCLMGIYKHFNFKYTEVGSYKTFTENQNV